MSRGRCIVCQGPRDVGSHGLGVCVPDETPEDPYVGLAREYNAVCDKLSTATARASELERECEAWRKLNEWAGEEWHSVTPAEPIGLLASGRFGMRGHRYGGTHSVGPFWYGEGDSPQDAAIDLATKLGLIGKGETNG